MDRSALIRAIIDLDLARSETETQRAMIRINELAPHASVSDLFFYPERDRSIDEIAEEAIAREHIWSQGGDEAVEKHVLAQLRAVLSDATISENDEHRLMAAQVLDAYEGDN